MQFATKDMKKLTVILKRIVTDKKKGIVTFKTNGDGVLHVRGANKFITFYTNMPCESADTASFDMPLYELDKWLSANEKKKTAKWVNMSLKVNKKSVKETQSNTAFKVEPSEWDETECRTLLAEGMALPKKEDYEEKEYRYIPPSPWNFIREQDRFLRVLKEGYETIKKNEDIRTLYLALRSGKAMVTEQRQTHLYRLDECFPFETLYLHRDALHVLSTAIKKGDIKHKKTLQGVYIQYGEFLFLLNDNQKTVFPNLRHLKTKKKPFTFRLDATALSEGIKPYTAAVAYVVVRFEEGMLTVTPSNPNFNKVTLPYVCTEGEPFECKFSFDVFKGFFASFEGDVAVEHVDYQNHRKQEGYLWRVYTPHQMNVAAGVSRLDFDLMDKLHAEGKLANVSRLQELDALVEEGKEPHNV